MLSRRLNHERESNLSEIEQLLGRMSDRVFDREALLREVLATKVMEWLKERRFYNNDLTLMRGIAHDILGLHHVGRHDGLSPDIERLHCMSFDSLSPVNLRECVMSALEYVGITEKTGVDLLGDDGWAALQQRVEMLSDAPSQSAGTAQSGEITAWSQLAMADLLVSLFNGEQHFNICVVDKLIPALDRVREASGMPQHEVNRVVKAALNALHCKDYEEMDASVRAGIKEAVWQACGLTEDVGRVAFGAHWERVKAVDVVATKVEQPSSKVSHTGRVRPFMFPLTVMVLLVAALALSCTLGFAIGKDKDHQDAKAQARLNQQEGVESAPPPLSPLVPATPQPLDQVGPGT